MKIECDNCGEMIPDNTYNDDDELVCPECGAPVSAKNPFEEEPDVFDHFLAEEED